MRCGASAKDHHVADDCWAEEQEDDEEVDNYVERVFEFTEEATQESPKVFHQYYFIQKFAKYYSRFM